MRAFDFHRAAGVRDVFDQQTHAPRDAFLAGGTTLIDLIKLDVMRPERVIDLNRLPLDQIERLPDGRMKVGALVRNSALAWHQEIQADYPVLSAALLAGASGQIRNMATTAGNLLQRTRCPYFRDNVSPCNKREPGSGCAAWNGVNRIHAVLGGSEACIATHPSDMCVALAALEPLIVAAGPAGERSIPFAEFHLLPGSTPERETVLRPNELITAVLLPPPRRDTRQVYVKLRDRESYEFALASAAVVLRIEQGFVRDPRIALGGVGTKPWRSPAAEAALRDRPVDRETFIAAAHAALQDAQPRDHNRFKIPLAEQALVRALTDATR